jgi:polyisoprenoid-binding protein YceI
MRPLPFHLPLLIAMSFALSFSTPATAQTVDLSRSEISFGFKQENVPGSGKFRKFTGQVSFDAAKPEATKASIEVDVTSVDLGDASWNSEIQGASWFNTKQFQKSVFTATGAKALGGDRFESPATFTLKGVTRDVTATFTAKPANGGTLIEGSVPLKRNEFKIGDGIWADTSVVANEVAVRFKVFLTKK